MRFRKRKMATAVFSIEKRGKSHPGINQDMELYGDDDPGKKGEEKAPGCDLVFRGDKREKRETVMSVILGVCGGKNVAEYEGLSFSPGQGGGGGRGGIRLQPKTIPSCRGGGQNF